MATSNTCATILLWPAVLLCWLGNNHKPVYAGTKRAQSSYAIYQFGPCYRKSEFLFVL